jgi:aminoglycoside/choline kinase family phosphotransferase
MTKTPYNLVSDERLTQLCTWLSEQGYNTDRLSPMSADAGFRRYFRLQTDNGSLIAVDAPPEHEDTATFLKVAHRLHKGGLVTPQVLCYNLEKGFMLQSDLGALHLQDAASGEAAQRLYQEALQSLITIQSQVSSDTLPEYNAAFLQQELDLFPEWYLQKHLQYHCDSDTRQQLQQCFEWCIETALEQPQVFVHRDYHCRNLMVTPDNRIAIIDFQGALRGPATYDLVSLLRDAYIEWPAAFLEPLIETHRQSLGQLTGTEVDPGTYRRWFDLTGLQRHLKILGIFCRLHYRDGKSGYLDSIPLVYKHIQNVCNTYPELEALCRVLDDSSILTTTMAASCACDDVGNAKQQADQGVEPSQ